MQFRLAASEVPGERRPRVGGCGGDRQNSAMGRALGEL